MPHVVLVIKFEQLTSRKEAPFIIRGNARAKKTDVVSCEEFAATSRGIHWGSIKSHGCGSALKYGNRAPECFTYIAGVQYSTRYTIPTAMQRAGAKAMAGADVIDATT